MKGIYCYVDCLTDDIVYIGKDSHIQYDTRHKNHLSHSRYDDQPFNRILQNNPQRYQYNILYQSEDATTDILNNLEVSLITRYNPRFNFTKGGDGMSGYVMPDEVKKKISKAHKGKSISEETRKKISEANKGRPSPRKGVKLSDETKRKLSEMRKGKNLGSENPNYNSSIQDGTILYNEYLKGLSYSELANKYNCGTATIQRRIKKATNGKNLRDTGINDEFLYEEWKSGITQKELAKRYGCSISCIEAHIRKMEGLYCQHLKK